VRLCEACGGTLGSRYHEVAHAPDAETASLEDLEAAAAIYDRALAEHRALKAKGPDKP